jgi:hypothetical protein
VLEHFLLAEKYIARLCIVEMNWLKICGRAHSTFHVRKKKKEWDGRQEEAGQEKEKDIKYGRMNGREI